MDIRRRQALIHNQTLFAEAIGAELTRLLIRPLTTEEETVVADITVCQGFMNSEADAHGLHFSTSQEKATQYLAHAARMVNEHRSSLIAEVMKGMPASMRSALRAEDHPNLIAWQQAIVDHLLQGEPPT